MQGHGAGGALSVIAFTNAVLLVGLFALRWPPGTIAFLFWFEAAVIGAVTFIKVTASAPGEFFGSAKRVTYARLPRPGESARVSSSVPRVNGYTAPVLFIAFYGALLAAYAALLLFSLKETDYPALIGSTLSSSSVRLAMVLIVGEHLWAFWRDYVRGPAWQRTDPTFHFWKPFGLAILTWLAFVLGFVVLGWLHSPLAVLAVLIVLKAIAELAGVVVDAQAGEWQRVDETP
jgi:hypothetical protein